MEDTTTTAIETIGCDLGDKRSELYVLRPDGGHTRETLRTTREAFERWFSRPRAHVVIEVGAHSRWVAELLTSLGHQVTIANPRRVKLISAADTKSDRRDSELLARLGRADTTLLAPIRHRPLQAQADLAVAKARDLLVATRTKLINHVRGTVKCFGLRLPSCSSASFAKKTRPLLPVPLRPALDPIYEALERVDQQIRQHDRTIDAVAKRYPELVAISQPDSVGTLTALVFMLTIEDKTRFTSSRTAGAYIGLRPRKNQSGDKDAQLGITKTGDAFVRRLLVNCANRILGPFGADCDLKRWGLELAKRGGKNAKKRANVAVARKLAVLMHRLWVTGEVYQPLGYRDSQRAAQAQAMCSRIGTEAKAEQGPPLCTPARHAHRPGVLGAVKGAPAPRAASRP
jgi:transposase